MMDQIYVSVRLPVTFEYTQNGKFVRDDLNDVPLLNLAFVGPKDQWYPLRKSVRPFRLGGYGVRCFSLVGMTFYALSFFNDRVKTEKMHAASFYAIMAYVYEVADPVRTTLAARLASLQRWHPLHGHAHAARPGPTTPESEFLRAVTARTREVADTLHGLDPAVAETFRQRVHAVYETTLAHLLLALASDNGGMSSVSFVSPHVIEDDVN
jgi:hypothetical protein